MTASVLTAERLREVLHYDPETGVFTRLKATSNRVVNEVGKQCGYNDGHGYLQICIDSRQYHLNCLAWLYVTGEWANGDVDHKDTIRSNNRWSNLRDVPHHVNTQNIRRANRDNKCGFLGVRKKGNRYLAQIKTDGIAKHIGSFDTAQQAHQAYVIAKRKQHQGCTL